MRRLKRSKEVEENQVNIVAQTVQLLLPKRKGQGNTDHDSRNPKTGCQPHGHLTYNLTVDTELGNGI